MARQPAVKRRPDPLVPSKNSLRTVNWYVLCAGVLVALGSALAQILNGSAIVPI